MPFSLFWHTVIVTTDSTTSTAPEWKLFQTLRASSGSISGILLLFFCLSLYAGMFQQYRTTYTTECSWFLGWMYMYTTFIFIFRLLHETSVYFWKKGAASQVQGVHFQKHVLCFVWLHVVSVPVVTILTIGGYVIMFGSDDMTTECAHRDVLLLSKIFLSMSVVCWIIKWLYMVAMMRCGDLMFLSRTFDERRFSRQMTPQFLTDRNGNSENAWTMTYPIVANVSDDVCTICLESITLGAPVRDFPCTHRFHVTCIDRWLTNHLTCPVCKRIIKNTNVLEEYQRRRTQSRQTIEVDVVVEDTGTDEVVGQGDEV